MKIIVGTPRSGTTYITRWMAWNLKLHLLGHDFSGEYLDGANLNFIFNDNWKPGQSIGTDHLDLWTQRAIDIIPSDRVIFKIHPHRISTLALDFLYQNPVTLIERKDRLSQFLSYGIAMHTDEWFKYHDHHFYDIKKPFLPIFTYQRSWFDILAKYLKEFDKIKNNHNNIQEIIYYENLNDYPPIPGITTLKQNPESTREKLKLVINSHELVEWIHELGGS